MAEYAIVDLAEMAHPPTRLLAAGSATDVDYREAVLDLSRRIGSAGRLVLAEGDDAEAVRDQLKGAGIETNLDVKTFQSGNCVYFYVNGPQPREFLRQYALRDPAAG